jgi:hypothetical protein
MGLLAGNLADSFQDEDQSESEGDDKGGCPIHSFTEPFG